MRQSTLFAVAALSTFAQGAVVDRKDTLQPRQIVNIGGNGEVDVQGNGAVQVKTVKAENIQGLTGANNGGILAGILDALNGANRGNRQNNKGHHGKGKTNNNNNCPPPPPPLTVTKTVYNNASIPAPLTVFVTQAAPPPVTVTQKPPAAAPQPPAAQPPAASQPAALPQVGANPAQGNNPTTSLNLGGLNGGANNNNQPAVAPAVPAATVPAAVNNPAAAQPGVSGLQLSSKLVLGNLVQQTIGLQARATPDAQVHAAVMPAGWKEDDEA
ncbi:hypothetical protein K4K55_005223 [Colletotrichum sp. SAR 10_96]|nr:hypothetical protein K4K55_005223 [Colletotrichum sp. SAR 10_96]